MFSRNFASTFSVISKTLVYNGTFVSRVTRDIHRLVVLYVP